LVRPSPHRVDITAAAIRVSDRLAGREPARLSVHGPPLAPARSWCRRRRSSRLPSAPLRSCGTEDGHGSGAARAAGIGGNPVHPAVTAHRAGTGMLARDPTAADPPLFAPSVLSAMPYMRQLASATAPEVARAHRQLKAAPDSAGNGPVDLPLGCRPWCSPTSGIVVAGRPRLNRMLPRSRFARDERASPLGCLTRLTLVPCRRFAGIPQATASRREEQRAGRFGPPGVPQCPDACGERVVNGSSGGRAGEPAGERGVSTPATGRDVKRARLRRA
jgi:hypothetical protein